MGLLDLFYPNESLKSAYEVDYEAFYAKGYRGVIFDIDNTLVKHGAPADEKSQELFLRLKKLGMKAVVLSNNGKKRVQGFAEKAGEKSGEKLSWIHLANKPFKRGYIKAMEKMGTNSKNTLFIGDQIFTDILGAKRLGIYCILTRPIDDKEEIQIVLKRIPEKIMLDSYEKKNRREHK